MVTILRGIDFLLGKLLFGIFKSTPLFKKRKINNVEIKKIFLIKFWGLGNLTIIWPLVYKIKEKYPDCFIFFLTFDLNEKFLEKNEAVNKIIYFKFTKNIFKIIIQAAAVLSALRKEKIDLVINFETFNTASALFSYLVKSPICAGLNNKYEKIFYTHYIDREPLLHISQIFLNLLNFLGINSVYSYHYFKESADGKTRIENVLKKYGVEKFICIHPGTSENFEGKRWSSNNFSELSNELIKKSGLPLLFTGVKREKDLVANIIEAVSIKGKILNLAGCLEIWEFVELIRRSFLLISNDTGPVHIAASLGVNMAVFYGPTTPQRYKSLNKNFLIFYKSIECSPCVGTSYINSGCKKNIECLDISPGDVVSKISERFFNEKNRAD